jgi:hypothetical protein
MYPQARGEEAPSAALVSSCLRSAREED